MAGEDPVEAEAAGELGLLVGRGPGPRVNTSSSISRSSSGASLMAAVASASAGSRSSGVGADDAQQLVVAARAAPPRRTAGRPGRARARAGAVAGGRRSTWVRRPAPWRTPRCCSPTQPNQPDLGPAHRRGRRRRPARSAARAVAAAPALGTDRQLHPGEVEVVVVAGVDRRPADGLVLAVDVDQEVAADLAVPAVAHQHRLAVDRARVPPGRVDEAARCSMATYAAIDASSSGPNSRSSTTHQPDRSPTMTRPINEEQNAPHA